MSPVPMLRTFLLLAVLFITAAAQAGEAGALKAGVFDPPRMAPDFTLPGSNGSELKLSAYRGKVVLLGFGFTSCAAVCPTTLATLKQVNKKLGTQARNLQVVYITVDPKHDDARRMKEYLALFDTSFIGGTGTAAQLLAVRKNYGVMAKEVAGPDGSFTHSSSIYLIDRKGRLRALMPYGRTADDYVHDVHILLAAP